MVWEPWDATEEELVELRTVRSMVPPILRPALKRWLREILSDQGRGYVSERRVQGLQSALRIELSQLGAVPYAESLIDYIEATHGDKMLLRVVDLLLFSMEPDTFGRRPGEVVDLEWHLDANSSAVKVTTNEAGRFTLARRLPDGVEEAVQIGVDAGSSSGTHLARAVGETRGVDADPSVAMAEAIKAVEAAAGRVVLPNERRAPQLGKIVAALKDKPGWGLRFRQRDDGHPDHRAVLVGMLETLAFAQPDRHGGHAPSVEEAQSHVMLASTLVEWFSSGTVVMNLAD